MFEVSKENERKVPLKRKRTCAALLMVEAAAGVTCHTYGL